MFLVFLRPNGVWVKHIFVCRCFKAMNVRSPAELSNLFSQGNWTVSMESVVLTAKFQSHFKFYFVLSKSCSERNILWTYQITELWRVIFFMFFWNRRASCTMETYCNFSKPPHRLKKQNKTKRTTNWSLIFELLQLIES